MRGLRLFVRPFEHADHDAVHAFLERNQAGALLLPLSASGFALVGKLLGEIVAVVTFTTTAAALRVEAIVVDRELRRKRIGKAMVREACLLAAKLERTRLEATVPDADAAFFRRTGFRQEEDRWVLDVTPSGA